MDPALQEYIEERQATALRTYENDPDLLTEHVRQEDSFRSGGYGTRQISELLQNAVDALGVGGGTGTVEFRLADGALYCANEGAPFVRDGVRAVTYAFLSTKRGEEIGRFGLGFKSILGITDHPQIYSRSVSFQFNAPETAELFAGIPNDGGRLPLLRIPTLADPVHAAAEDPNLAEMMVWASTVVKLPLTREGERLRAELLGFETEALLFFKPLERLRISIQKSSGSAPETREYSREGHPDEGEVHLIKPAGERERWLYAEREFRPTVEVAATLQSTALRESMTVAYAVRPEGRQSIGRLWAWFPLKDETTASGVFNAPWEVNDDRTSLVPGSILNLALLAVGAELFLDVVVRASTSADPAAHLDLFPARGREARSNADRLLSEEIPRRAGLRAMIPDAFGELRVPGYFHHVPDLQKTPIPAELARRWNEHVQRSTMPHWQTFSTRTRRLRLRTLLGGSEESRSAREIGVAAWLEELAKSGSGGVAAALQIAVALRAASPETSAAIGGAPIVPIEGGGWARADAHPTVLIPLRGEPTPDGVRVVAAEVCADEDSEAALRALGFRTLSTDEVVLALGNSASAAWGAMEWARFWKAGAKARPESVREALSAISARRLDPLLPTQSGEWRPGFEVLAVPGFASHLAARQLDASLVPNLQLAVTAGAATKPKPGLPAARDRLWPKYASAIEAMLRKTLDREGIKPARITIPDDPIIGPLDLLDEAISEEDRVIWTRGILEQLSGLMREFRVPVSGREFAVIDGSRFEWWAVRNLGRIRTTQGPRRVTDAVSSRLAEFGPYLPVAAEPEVSRIAGLPTDLEAVADAHLEEFLARDSYDVAAAGVEAFVQLMRESSSRASIAKPVTIPAVSKGTVVLTPAAEVAVTEQQTDIAALDEAGVSYVPTNGHHGALVAKWGLLTSADALQQTLEVIGLGESTPVLDLYPSLQNSVVVRLAKQRVAKAQSIARVLQSIHGVSKRPLMAAKQDGQLVVDESLEDDQALAQISHLLELGLSAYDIAGILRDDENLRRSELIARAQVARTDEERLLILVGRDTLKGELPKGLLAAVESKAGNQTDDGIAQLFLRAHGNDSVRVLRAHLKQRGVPVPQAWDGSPQAQEIVKRLGFGTAFAGEREVRPPRVTQVQGKITLNELHDFQRDLAVQIRGLALTRTESGDAARGLLYLPTGAGKTRVTAEAVLTMMRDGELTSPVLWIAQSQELCEQAIQTFGEVWRWLGDERPIDLSRFWSGYELDESNEELQVVFAIDDTLDSRLGEATYDWLTQASLIVIDEAHTAGDSPTYTRILRHLGIVQGAGAQTARPLLGLTATPFKGRNAEVNEQFAKRFGSNPLRALDPEDPVGELRSRRVLAEVDHEVLHGLTYSMDEQGLRMKEVSKAMLDRIGSDISRTQLVVEHIARQPEDWPVLVFTPSVAAAHTTAALLQLAGIESDAVDGSMRKSERRRVIEKFKGGGSRVLVNCDLLTQGFDAPKVRALYIARPTFSPNRYLQMVGRGLRGPENGGTDRCLIVNVADTFEQFGQQLAYNEFDYLWSKK
jgi:superfamily II DNA or RNA helicase